MQDARAMLRQPRRAIRILLTVMLLLACWPNALRGQDPPRGQADRGRLFAGGSALVWSARGTQPDPPGHGFNRPHFHGALEWPAAGLLLNGGVFMSSRWSVGAELTLRAARSTPILEQSRSRFEFVDVSSLLTDRERLVSPVVRYYVAARSLAVEPLAGVTVSQSTRTLSNRQGVFFSPAGTLPLEPPDTEVRRMSVGLVGGADGILRHDKPVAVVLGVRLHWIPRSRERTLPRADPFVLQVAAGLQWRSSRVP